MEVPEVSRITGAGEQTILQRTPGHSVSISGAQGEAIFPSRGHLATSRDKFNCYNWENANDMQQIGPKQAAKQPEIDRKTPTTDSSPAQDGNSQESPVSM